MISCLACLFFDYAIYEVSANTRENSLSSSSNFFLLVESFMERYFVFLVVHDEVSKQEGKGNINQLFYVHFCLTSINVGILRRVTHFRHFSYRGTIYAFTAFRYFHKLRSSTFCPIEYNILFCNARKFFCFAIILLHT